jgi:ribosome-binding protein aMBF1 (putative translation factor)
MQDQNALSSPQTYPRGFAVLYAYAVIRLLRKKELARQMKCYKMQAMIKLVQELEEYRLKNRIPQENLAQKLDVAFSTVNRWINGKTKPNKTQRYHIEKLLRKKDRGAK